jgi:toxin FitB
VTETTDSRAAVVDSSGWIEYFGDGKKAEQFAPYLEREDLLIVPPVIFYEVYKKLTNEASKMVVLRFVSHALRARNPIFDSDMAMAAAQVSLDHKLAMADAIIYATALRLKADIVTADHHFQSLPGVVLI